MPLRFWIPVNSTFIRARNNVISATRCALYKVNPVDLDSDWDNLYTMDEGRFVSWHETRYATLDDFQVATTQELNGLATEPDLSDPAKGDFAHTRQSPLVDRGIWLSGD